MLERLLPYTDLVLFDLKLLDRSSTTFSQAFPTHRSGEPEPHP